MNKGSLVYITFDGVSTNLGYSQVLCYLNCLAESGYDVTLISFESKSLLEIQNHKYEIRGGISWNRIYYPLRDSFLKKVICVFRSIFEIRALIKSVSPRVIHCRSYVAFFLGLLATRGIVDASHLIFDIRGFWVDERFEGKIWRENWAVKRFLYIWERYLFSNAKTIITLTHRSIERLEVLTDGKCKRIEVIPTCVSDELLDFGRLRNVGEFKNFDRPIRIGWIGSTGTWYDFGLFCDLVRSSIKLKPISFQWVVFTSQMSPDDETRIEALRRSGFDVEVSSFDEVSKLDSLGSLAGAVSFVRPLESKVASFPTKLAEIWAFGIPCLSIRGVGDTDSIKYQPCFTFLDDHESLEAALCHYVKTLNSEAISEYCRTIAESMSIANACIALERIYERNEDD